MPPRASLQLPESRWVDVDGPVHYRRWDGPAEGPTFVCVHGFAGSQLNWALAAPGLARMGRVLALDLAGFGETPLAGRGADAASSTRLLDGFIRALELPPVILVGNSMGGRIALLQAATAPETIRSLVLVDAAFPRDRLRAPHTAPKVAAGMVAMSSGSRLAARAARARARSLGAERLVRETLRLCTVDVSRVDPALIDMMVELAERRQLNPDVLAALSQAARSLTGDYVLPEAYRRQVRHIDHPALVIHGLHDLLVPVAFARRAVRDHPHWDLVVFSDLGHVPMIEAPQRFVAVVEAWLVGRGGTSSGASAGA